MDAPNPFLVEQFPGREGDKFCGLAYLAFPRCHCSYLSQWPLTHWELLFGVENGTDVLFRLRCPGVRHAVQFVRYVSTVRNNLLPPTARWKHCSLPYYTASHMSKL
jgi:hypothetical protein